MSLRRRMVLLTAAAVALAVALSALACYLAVSRSLHDRVDHQLGSVGAAVTAAARALPRGEGVGRDHPSSPLIRKLIRPVLQSNGAVAIFNATGTIRSAVQEPSAFALTPRDLAVARGAAGAYFREGRVGSTPVRAYVAPAGHGRAVIVEQSLSELQNTLHQLAVILIVIALVGVALAGVLGMLVARAAAAPVHALRQAAEHVGETGDLSRRIEPIGADDLGRLARSFNTMLAALEASQRTQRQLIADASHELRTPIATLRTNLEVLLRNPDLAPAERAALLEDLSEQSAELGALVADLLESARDRDESIGAAPFRLDELVRAEIERFASAHPDLRFRSEVEPCVLRARESRLRRAFSNLLDNAVKWSPPDGRIEVRLRSGELSVRDHGPGFRGEDLPYVFDRFYRSEAARSVPGSGLGLSIVRKVAAEHGGEVRATNADGGGALVTLSLAARPAAATPESDEAPATHATPAR